MRRYFSLSVSFLLVVGLSALPVLPIQAQPNVLLVNIDDLNNFPANYYPDLDTPNIDRLAASGVAFKNAHSPVPACNPSRTAILMGMHPDITGITLNSQYDFRNDAPILADKPSMPQHFRDSGYRIVGAGKLFHLPNDDAGYTTWDEYTLEVAEGTINDYDVPGGRPMNGLTGLALTDPDGIMGILPTGHDWGYFEFEDDPDTYTGISDASVFPDRTDETPDYERATWGVTKIQEAASTVEPMFVSVGFYRPHVPLYCPKRFFDMIADPITDPPYLATDLTDIADPMGWISVDADMEFASARDGVDYENQMTRSYVACVAFADEQLGRLLDAVDASQEQWIVILWGDHGWQTGEKDRWQKFTLWDRGTRTTLIMSGPDFTPGIEIDVAVSLLDIFPTLTDYAGLATPTHLSGRSLRRLLDGIAEDHPIKLVFDGSWNSFLAVKSEEWTYILNTTTGTDELYDKVVDPNEWWNVADNPANDAIKEWLVPEPSVETLLLFGTMGLAAIGARRRASSNRGATHGRRERSPSVRVTMRTAIP